MIKSFFSFILIFLIFISSLGVTVYRVKDPEFLSQNVRSANLYGRLTGSLPKLLDDNIFKDSSLSKEDIVDVLTATIDSETFYSFFDQAAQAYLPWVSGKTSIIAFRYDLAAVKVKARDKAVDRLVTKYNALPVCDSKQIKTWSTENGLPNCQLPATNVRSNDISRLLGEQIDTVLSGVPAEITGHENPALLKLRAQVSFALRVITLVWAVTFGFLLLYLLILRRHAFLSLAFVFLLTGLIEAAFGLIAWDWVGKIVTDSLPTSISGFVPVIVEVSTAILDVLKRSLATLSISLIIVGAAFLVLWIFYRPRSAHSAVTTTK